MSGKGGTFRPEVAQELGQFHPMHVTEAKKDDMDALAEYGGDNIELPFQITPFDLKGRN